LPGDDRLASTHLTGGTNGAGGTLGNGVIEGDWDSSTLTTEAGLFWQHVRLAGLAAGPTSTSDANYLPTNTDGGRIGIESVSTFGGPTGLAGAFVICSAGVLGKFAKQLDTSLDDSETSTGSFRAYATGTTPVWATSNVASPTILDNSTYNVCLSF